MGALSFDNEKHLSCASGGAILTNNEEYYRRTINFASTRGAYTEDSSIGRQHRVLGTNYRFDVVRMPMAMAQLGELEKLVGRRRELGRKLSEAISEIEGIKPCPVPERGDAFYWIYPLIVDVGQFSASLDEIALAMRAEGLKGIGTGRYYLLPEGCPVLNDMRLTYETCAKPGGKPDNYLNRDYDSANLPGARSYVERMLRWQFTEKYKDRDIEDIAGIIKKVAGHYRK